QQRFMLQGLGLAVMPLARLFDRARLLRAVAAIVLAAHLLTPQTWPVASREAEIPWDLSPLIPNAISPLLPVLSRAGGLARPCPPAAVASLGLILAMGWAAAVAAWGWSRSRTASGWRPGAVAAALAGLAWLLVLGAVDARSFLADMRHAFYPPFPD